MEAKLKRKKRKTHQQILVRIGTYHRLRELATENDIPVTALVDKLVRKSEAASPSEPQQN